MEVIFRCPYTKKKPLFDFSGSSWAPLACRHLRSCDSHKSDWHFRPWTVDRLKMKRATDIHGNKKNRLVSLNSSLVCSWLLIMHRYWSGQIYIRYKRLDRDLVRFVTRPHRNMDVWPRKLRHPISKTTALLRHPVKIFLEFVPITKSRIRSLEVNVQG